MENLNYLNDHKQIIADLYNQICAEAEKIIISQLKILNVTQEEWMQDGKKYVYPDDPNAIAEYRYKDQTILIIRLGENRMSVDFDIPVLEPQEKQYEVTTA